MISDIQSWVPLFTITTPLVMAIFIATWIQHKKFEAMNAPVCSLDSRISSLDARMLTIETRMIGVENRMGALETNMGVLNTRMIALETNMGVLNTRMIALETHMDEFRREVIAVLRELDRRLSRARGAHRARSAWLKHPNPELRPLAKAELLCVMRISREAPVSMQQPVAAEKANFHHSLR